MLSQAAFNKTTLNNFKYHCFLTRTKNIKYAITGVRTIPTINQTQNERSAPFAIIPKRIARPKYTTKPINSINVATQPPHHTNKK